MTGRGDFAAVCWARVPEALQALSVHMREQGPGESERPVRVSAGQLQAQAVSGVWVTDPRNLWVSEPTDRGPSADRHHPEKARPGWGTVTTKPRLSPTRVTCGGKTAMFKEKKLCVKMCISGQNTFSLTSKPAVTR